MLGPVRAHSAVQAPGGHGTAGVVPTAEGAAAVQRIGPSSATLSTSRYEARAPKKTAPFGGSLPKLPLSMEPPEGCLRVCLLWTLPLTPRAVTQVVVNKLRLRPTRPRSNAPPQRPWAPAAGEPKSGPGVRFFTKKKNSTTRYRKSDLRNHQAIVQPRLYDCLMVTQIILNTEPHGFDSCRGRSTAKSFGNGLDA